MRSPADCRIEVSLSKEERARLETVAARGARPVTELFRVAMNEWLKRERVDLRLRERRRLGRPLG